MIVAQLDAGMGQSDVSFAVVSSQALPISADSQGMLLIAR